MVEERLGQSVPNSIMKLVNEEENSGMLLKKLVSDHSSVSSKITNT